MSLTDTSGFPPYLGLQYEESEALKLHLSGLILRDSNGRPRPVTVRFRLPERELAKVTYPFILLDFLGMRRDPSREHRGTVLYGYEAYTSNLLPEPGASGQYPIPMLLTFQVTTATRSNVEDVQLTDMLSTTLLPWRFGQLYCPSGTVRRLDVLGFSPADSFDGDGKRIFRKVWTIEISAELVPNLSPATPAKDINITVTDTVTGQVDYQSPAAS